jgi:hypothetical protein
MQAMFWGGRCRGGEDIGREQGLGGLGGEGGEGCAVWFCDHLSTGAGLALHAA